MSGFFDPAYHDLISARHQRVVLEPSLAHGSGPVFVHAGRAGHGERIILPLADDGENGDGLVGATIYPVPPGGDMDAASPPAETVLFFSLD